MGQKTLLLNEDDEKNVKFSSNKSFCCRSSVGFLIVVLLTSSCVFTGLYFGFMFAEENALGKFTVDNPAVDQDVYQIGVGRKDVTGPIVQVNMMGYANPDQVASGLHQRLYARSFVVADDKSRVCFVTVDSGMASQIVKLEVVKKLKERYGDLYTEKNVVISGTHSHSGPAGFFQTILPMVTSLGFIRETTDSFVNGIFASIQQAHSSMKPGKISFSVEKVNEGNINRSPYAYDHDPLNERNTYTHNTGQELSLLKFTSTSGEPIGMFNWYPVHGTSMNETNTLISSDNKGRASALFEKSMRKQFENVTGQESFVGAFASANLGDVSPNTKGAKCIDTGEDCVYATSTCGNPPRVQKCIAFGPGRDMFESTDIIAHKQLDAALKAFNNAKTQVNGSIGFVHQYVDMSKQPVQLEDGANITTCKPGMGYSFAAGTTDGPGAFDFTQAMTRGKITWDLVRDDVIVPVVCKEKPPQSYYDCHHPKPVLLPTGYMDKPYAWHPHIIDVQILKIGQVFMVAIPGEFTTMSGRRMKEAVKKVAIQNGVKNPQVVLSGLSNVYTHYITTPEEYGAQRYEGGSTIFGPHTFTAYLQKFTQLASSLLKGVKVESGPQPDNILSEQIQLIPPPLADAVPDGKKFGDVITDVNTSYKPGETVTVKFYGANPRHNLKLDGTYLKVQYLLNNQTWVDVYHDNDWTTKFKWEERVEFGGESTRVKKNKLMSLFEYVAMTTGHKFDVMGAVEGNLDLGEHEKPDEVFYKHLKNSKTYLESNKHSLKAEPGSTSESHVTIEWGIPSDEKAGKYRIVYQGDKLDPEWKNVTSFTGTSGVFEVTKQ